ncbi:helix-turn-helix domain-containing protein [Paenibacillus aurantius]|uniref:Helix-turn-helix domain-containing protein n=1 Tax=Paenibacillus aurantius TaxID=2918900 RepID=A0AA96RK44_9BACL|nr:helix-turn-helix domain-containing protein [Paenibacillus aurantius]WNQ13964.1 helix-turn-helix domain-containing protein [Paenibacillus aurantius]
MNRLLLFYPRGKMFFYKLMAGLFLVAVIPTAATVYALHHQFIKSMMDEIGNSNTKLLEQASLNGNMMINEMTYTASALLNDPSVSYFMQTDYTSDAKLFNDLMDKLGTMRSGSRYLSSIYVVFDRFDYVIGTHTTNNAFLLPIQQTTALDETMLHSDYTRFYFYPDEGDRMLYMVRPIQNASYQTVGAIVITVSAAKFKEIFEPIRTSDKDTITILDEKNQTIWCEGNDCSWESLQAVAADPIPGNYRTVKREHQNLVVSRSELSLNKWTLVSLLPAERLTSKISVFGQMSLLIFLLASTVAVMFSFVYGRILYRPLRSLLRRILNNPTVDSAPGGSDEFGIIDQLYHKVLNNKAHLETFLDTNKDLMRNQLLFNVVEGRELNEGAIREKLSLLGGDLPFDYFFAVFIKGFKMEIWDKASYHDSAAGKLSAYMLAEELMEKYALKGLAFEMDSDTVVLLVNSDNQDENRKNHFVKEMKSAMIELVPFPLRIGVGGYVSGWAQIYESCRQARYSLVYHTDVSSDMALPTMQVAFYEKKICYSLANADESGVMQAVDDLISYAKGKSSITWTQNMNMWLQVLSASIKKLEELHVILYQELMQRAVYHELANLESAQDLQSWVKRFYKEIISRLHDLDEKSDTHGKVEMAKTMIGEQYDQELTLESLAGQIGLNPAYFSKLFKDGTGINYVEYVNKLRINKSKELLQRFPHMPLDEVAKKVGYHNTQSFNRFFKKYESCTPGQYRRQLN